MSNTITDLKFSHIFNSLLILLMCRTNKILLILQPLNNGLNHV
nr:MAG TPA: hypothetical protein [Caudoviricetes sp.]